MENTGKHCALEDTSLHTFAIIFNSYATFAQKNLGCIETLFGSVHLQSIDCLEYLILYVLNSFRNKMDAFFN